MIYRAYACSWCGALFTGRAVPSDGCPVCGRVCGRESIKWGRKA